MKIGLALSGGGILGVAHLGLLEELDKNKIKIDYISGTSSGAMVGALYSAGGTSRIHHFLTYLKDRGAFNKTSAILFDSTYKKLVQGINVFLENEKFENFKTKLIVVTTEITDGETVLFEEGNMIDPVIASFGYPGFLPYHEIKGKYYIDGGVLMNLPASVLVDKGCDFIMGSYMPRLAKLRVVDGKLRLSRIETFARAIDIVQKKLCLPQLELCDACLVPPLENIGIGQMEHIDKIIDIGRDYAKKNINNIIKKLIKKESASNIK